MVTSNDHGLKKYARWRRERTSYNIMEELYEAIKASDHEKYKSFFHEKYSI